MIALRRCAQRVLALDAEANDLETELEQIVARVLPALLAEPGVGPISAAQLLLEQVPRQLLTGSSWPLPSCSVGPGNRRLTSALVGGPVR